jgi:uncharacterized protein YgiM (DUF1202 family)
MFRRSSKVFTATLLPFALAGCVEVYTTPEPDTLPAPLPPEPENIDPSRGQGGPDSGSFPPVVVTPTQPVETVKATPEQPIPGQLKARYSTSRINVREGPGTDYSVLFSVHPQDTVMITNEVRGNDGYQWYQVNHADWGWVREDLLKLEEGFATVTAKHANSVINVREGPSQNYRVIHEAYVGDHFPVAEQSWDGDGYAWYLLDLNYSGWVRSDLITKGTAAFE